MYYIIATNSQQYVTRRAGRFALTVFDDTAIKFSSAPTQSELVALQDKLSERNPETAVRLHVMTIDEPADPAVQAIYRDSIDRGLIDAHSTKITQLALIRREIVYIANLLPGNREIALARLDELTQLAEYLMT